MKIKHHVPVERLMKPDPISPEYQAEIDQTMARAEAEYRRAQRRLEREEQQLSRLRSKRTTKHRKRAIKELEALVELRRMEVQDWHRMLVATPQSAQHRGIKGHRHVPSPGVF